MTLLLRSGASIDRSSPVLRSSSKAPNTTRPEGRVCIGTVHRIQNTKLYQCAPELSKQKHQARLANFLKNQQLPDFTPISSQRHGCSIYNVSPLRETAV